MAAAPTFSVVIAAYDAAATIEAAIGSALAQTRDDVEVVVVDDGSRDETAARVTALAKDARIRLVRQANAGPSAARNVGIAAARGRLISMLDSDDLLLPGYLDMMERALAAAPEAGFAYTDAWTLEEETGRFRVITAMGRAEPPERTLPADEFLIQLVRRNFVFNAITARAEALHAVGGYAEDLRYSEDYELWLRLAASGWPGVRVAPPMAIQRDRAGSLSKNEIAMFRGAREAYRRVAETHSAGEPVKAVARRNVAELDRLIRRRERGGPARATVRGALNLLRRLRRVATTRRRTRAIPPPDVADAFPALGRGRGGARGRRPGP